MDGWLRRNVDVLAIGVLVLAAGVGSMVSRAADHAWWLARPSRAAIAEVQPQLRVMHSEMRKAAREFGDELRKVEVEMRHEAETFRRDAGSVKRDAHEVRAEFRRAIEEVRREFREIFQSRPLRWE